MEQSTTHFAGSKLIEMAFSLLLVIIAIFIFAYIFRKIFALRASTRDMKIVGQLLVGSSKERLMLVDVAGTRLLLGITAHTIQNLHQYPSPARTSKKNNGYDVSRPTPRSEPSKSALKNNQYLNEKNDYLPESSPTNSNN